MKRFVLYLAILSIGLAGCALQETPPLGTPVETPEVVETESPTPTQEPLPTQEIEDKVKGGVYIAELKEEIVESIIDFAPNEATEAFRGVLLGQTKFRVTQEYYEKTDYTLNEYYEGMLTFDIENGAVYEFRFNVAVVDMDGDGIPEVVVQPNIDSTTILRYSDGIVYGYCGFSVRSMGIIKTDGTYNTSSGLGNGSIERMSFTESGYERITLASWGYSSGDPSSFFIDGEEVSEEEYYVIRDAQSSAQAAKENAVWFDLADGSVLEYVRGE